MHINLPKKGGYEVLADIKNDKKLCNISVIMLSGSKEQMDIIQSYELKASSHIIKARGLKEFQRVAIAIERCWFKGLVSA